MSATPASAVSAAKLGDHAAKAKVEAGVLEIVAGLRAAVRAAVRGKDEVVDLALSTVIAGGHLLLEDVPGVGKTTLASALSCALGGRFSRVQLTADLLPSDLLGALVLDAETGQLRFAEGPLFAHVVLADELNRTPPRTQSALFEAMEEGQVSVEGQTRPLPAPFLVIATQNPTEHLGTFPLPDSQLDRFMMRLQLGYPAREDERAVLRAAGQHRVSAAPVTSPAGLAEVIAAARGVSVAEGLEDWILDLVGRTRSSPALHRGVSPRGAQSLYRAARALALVSGRSYVIPEDLVRLAVPVLAHRVVPKSARVGGIEGAVAAIEALRDALPPPR